MTRVNDEQAKLWNGPAGRAWVDGQQLLDRMFEPFEILLVNEASAGGTRTVLDVGCGSGSTTLAIARHLGGAGESLGVDISEPLIAAAKAGAQRETARVDFICADAQTHVFDASKFDVIVSRFGVMFFDDFVQAFSNLRRAVAKDGRLRAITFRSPAENPFMTTAERAAAPLVPNLPARRPDAPGQFALADSRRMTSILEQSGWADIDIRPLDVECAFPAQELDRYLTRLGPVGLILEQVEASTRIKVVQAVREAFEAYVRGAEVRFTAACWMMGARNAAG